MIIKDAFAFVSSILTFALAVLVALSAIDKGQYEWLILLAPVATYCIVLTVNSFSRREP